MNSTNTERISFTGLQTAATSYSASHRTEVSNYYYQLKRLDIQTGELIELTTDLDKATNKRPLAWLPE